MGVIYVEILIEVGVRKSDLIVVDPDSLFHYISKASVSCRPWSLSSLCGKVISKDGVMPKGIGVA